jgi:AbrB family transcriptional regulator (stage V sporulation protein T)
MHVREADAMEIYTDGEGQIILKKYSPIGEMTDFAKQYAESLAQVSGHAALITDRDQFIATAGGYRHLAGKPVSRQLDERINRRETVIASKGDHAFIPVSENDGEIYVHQMIVPILCEGDVIGSVMLLEDDNKEKMGEVEKKLVLSAAGFLGKRVEQ